MGERLLCMQEVRGSNPLSSTNHLQKYNRIHLIAYNIFTPAERPINGSEIT